MATRDTRQLAILEQQWLRKQRRVVKDRAGAYERMGVYAAWRDIFREYAQLAGHDMEALKRALYIAWTHRSQNPLLSGIKDLDDQTVREVLSVADNLAGKDALDAELRWMLSYYYLVEPAYLDRFDGLEHLKQASRDEPLRYRRECPRASFRGRGQMGRYWRSKQMILRWWP